MASSLTLNTVQYKPVSTSCVKPYITKHGGLPQDTPAYFNISHPNGGVLSFINGGNGKVHLKQGNPINFQKYTGNDVYNAQSDNLAFFKDGNSSLSMRHTGFIIYLHPFTPNNFDFAWYLEPDGNGFNIFNEYGGGTYLGYNPETDELMIVPPANKVTWLINEYAAVESKSIRKALAYMNRGQGEYNNSFQELPACVFPEETKNLMNLKGCSLKNKGDVLNTDFVSTLGHPIILDPANPDTVREADEDIIEGKVLFPSRGCAIRTDERNIFTQAVSNSGTVIDSENQKILDALRNKISGLKSEIKDLKYVKIPAQRNKLNAARNTYEKTAADCDYYIWLKGWLNDVGIPWAVSIEKDWINAVNNLQTYWPVVNNEGQFWAQKCREVYGVALFFEHCGFKGKGGVVRSGTTIRHLDRSWNDTISAIIVPPGVSVTIWEDIADSGSGKIAKVDGAVGCLVDWRYGGRGGNWNDQITGIRVEGQANTSAWSFNMQQLPP